MLIIELKRMLIIELSSRMLIIELSKKTACRTNKKTALREFQETYTIIKLIRFHELKSLKIFTDNNSYIVI